jgi:hypothetical protein
MSVAKTIQRQPREQGKILGAQDRNMEKKSHNEENINLHTSSNINTDFKIKRLLGLMP